MEERQGQPVPGQALRDLSYHPAVAKDIKKLDPQIARAAVATLEKLRRGETHPSDHPLNGPLKGWRAVDVQGHGKTHRITYRNVPNGPVEVGHVGPHNYDQAVQRLAASEQEHLTPDFDWPSDGNSTPERLLGRRMIRDAQEASSRAQEKTTKALRSKSAEDHHDAADAHYSASDAWAMIPGREENSEQHAEEGAWHARRGDEILDGKQASLHTAMGQAGPDYDNLSFHVGTHELYPEETTLFAHHPEHGDVGRLTYREMHHPTWTGFPERAVHVIMMQTHPDHRRRGVADQMMNHLEHNMFKDVPISHGDRLPDGNDWSQSHYQDQGGKRGISGEYYGAPSEWTMNGKPWNVHTKKFRRIRKQKAKAAAWYHISPHEFSPGETVHPRSRTGVEPQFGNSPRPANRVYLSNDPDEAEVWANVIGDQREGNGLDRTVHTYEVEPVGRPTKHETDIGLPEYRAPRAKVIRRTSARYENPMDNPHERLRNSNGTQAVMDIHEGGQHRATLCAPHAHAHMSLDTHENILGLETGLMDHDAPEREYELKNHRLGRCQTCTRSQQMDHDLLKRMHDTENRGQQERRPNLTSPFSNGKPVGNWDMRGAPRAHEEFQPRLPQSMNSKTAELDNGSWILYHGTSKENADRIEQEGFKHGNETNGQHSGNGFYFHENPRKAAQYGDHIVVVEATPRDFSIHHNPWSDPDVDHDHVSESLQHMGFDGHRDPDDHAVVLYHPHQIHYLTHMHKSEWGLGKQARFTPNKRVFAPTCGLDHRLFDGTHLKPDVRRYVMRTVRVMWMQYKDWSKWAIVYFAGSEASEWTDTNLEGNNDFDVLVGVDYDKFRKYNPDYINYGNDDITKKFNDGFRAYNGPTILTIDGKKYGPFDRTTYVNPDSYDIKKIKPYAAYNVSDDKWVVKPPHLPHWSLSELPRAVQNVLKACDTLANDVLKLPEPQRTQQGAALFDAWHSDRSRAFSDNGEGWFDIANLREKWLDQEGTWAELVNCKHRYDEGLGAAPVDWSNTPTGYKVTSALVDDVRSHLTDDLLHPKYRSREDRKPTSGHCYAATEAMYHMLGGKDAGYKPMQVHHEGDSHWFLQGPKGEIIDPTHDQFSTPVPYDKAKGKGFLTKAPSSRAQEIIRRVQGSASNPSNWNINEKTRDAQRELEFARKNKNTADRSSADPEYQEALDAYKEDSQRDYDQAVLNIWHAQRPNAPREASKATETLDEVGRSEHPNVDQYRSGGMGHLEGDESRSVVGFMPVREMRKYREHNGDWNGEHSEETVQRIRQDIRDGKGIHTPLTVHYDDQRKWGYIGEGNHRLRAAHEEGLRTVPVRVVRNSNLSQQKRRLIGDHMDLEERFDPRDSSYVPSDIHPYHFLKESSLGRADALYGKGELHHLFPVDEDGPTPTTNAPWASAARSKTRRDYDPDVVRHAMQFPHEHPSEEIDPRTLHATQPSITRAGVAHYMTDEYRQTGRTFADQHNLGNQRPVVYKREDGQNLLLSGHHRGAAALLKGEPLHAVVLHGPWGPPR